MDEQPESRDPPDDPVRCCQTTRAPVGVCPQQRGDLRRRCVPTDHPTVKDAT
ncbi:MULTISPECIES: hypothetical protein [Nocardiopsis]|uniref:Uncharacterized protein n=1 Tax=Nocardiopsis lambiniae TaxID=3075539 RepID=A0ABU2M8H8_9ACTN|nr:MULTISPECIES: hypothetical protein [unclassified Nocardiopsis]MDE3720724.1 hypothetical protein [Nocardiopsis sp. N85]MDT0328969.1 hypothetical protein [Nocardiopsis sp. DSM 44743]